MVIEQQSLSTYKSNYSQNGQFHCLFSRQQTYSIKLGPTSRPFTPHSAERIETVARFYRLPRALN